MFLQNSLTPIQNTRMLTTTTTTTRTAALVAIVDNMSLLLLCLYNLFLFLMIANTINLSPSTAATAQHP